MLEGKVALITGAASGQGRAASVLFASHGASIAVVDIRDDDARTFAGEELRGGAPHAAPGAGDQRDLALESSSHVLLSGP